MIAPPTWFDRPAKIAALRALAESLVGTPFFPNSEAPGRDGGMDCVHLINYIDRTLGLFGQIEIPPQIMDHAQHSERSALIEAFETWPALKARFARVTDCSPENILPGDHLCFLFGKAPHHGGLMLDRGEFLQTLRPEGAHLMLLRAAVRGWKILGQLAAVYRPLPDSLAPAATATAEPQPGLILPAEITQPVATGVSFSP